MALWNSSNTNCLQHNNYKELHHCSNVFHHSLGEYPWKGKTSVSKSTQKSRSEHVMQSQQLKTWPWKGLQRDPEYLRVEVEVQSDFTHLKVAAWDKHSHLIVQIPIPFLYKAKEERRESVDKMCQQQGHDLGSILFFSGTLWQLQMYS